MGNLIFSSEIVLPLFITLAVGYGLSRLGVFTPDFLAVCNRLCFTVLLPLMLFNNISNSDFKTAFQPGLILYAALAVLAVFGLLCVIIPLCIKIPEQRGVVIQGIFRSNYLLFGTPLCVNMFGAAGGAAAAVLAAFIVPLFNILAVCALAVFTKDGAEIPWRKTVKQIATNPLILGAAAGLIFVGLRWRLPEVVMRPMEDIAGIATTLSLLMLGGDFQFRRVAGKLRVLTLSTLGRLVAVPSLTLAVAALLGFRGASYAALLALFGSPVSVSSYVMARSAGADAELAGQMVVFTTCFSLVSIFALVYISRALSLV